MTPWIIIAALVALVAVITFAGSFIAERKVATLRARGLYPEPGRENEADVLRLLGAGERIMAIRCYRQVHQVGLKEAKEAVTRLETSASR